MTAVVLACLGWLALSIVLGSLVGRMIRRADEAAAPARSAHHTDWAGGES